MAENSAEGIEGGPRGGCDAPAEGVAPDSSEPEDLELESDLSESGG